ncbi:MAG TPA: tRNA (adenosine(37)-N6)-dimethylallyltransferase MiaA [Candidatus Manganitrophaceae bacterium]|nr:tRNA (adenosine(37)-N6)-dimethylallyltransferase MiaA [Candidatus Manganitrophaceae bacterium]
MKRRPALDQRLLHPAPDSASPRPPWFLLVGPTAVGKSAVAERLAPALGTEIIVADSRQIYRGMDIGTAKPSAESRRRVPRRLIDVVSPDQSFSAGAYKKLAEAKAAEMEAKGKAVFIEGGTGLYIKALLYGLWEGPPADWALRQKWAEREKEEAGTLHRLLAEVDPDAARRIHPRDIPKVTRALEVFHLTGRPLSHFHDRHRFEASPAPPFRMVGMRREREDLYRRIEARVDRQVADGLAAETERFLAGGLSPSLQSMRGLGYRQMIPYLQGERTLEEAVSLLKRDTRRYAKRQMTWFQADPRIEWIDVKDGETAEETADRIKHLKNYRIML